MAQPAPAPKAAEPDVIKSQPATSESARPHPFKPGRFPRAVRALLQYARDECRHQGGGCNLDIVVARKRGGFRNAFSGRVLEYQMLPGEKARTIRFRLHGSYCGGFGAQACVKEKAITAAPFAFKQP